MKIKAKTLLHITLGMVALMTGAIVLADVPGAGPRAEIETQVTAELLKVNPKTRVRLNGPLQIAGNTDQALLKGVRYLGDNGKGDAFFRLDLESKAGISSVDLVAPYSAMMQVPVAVRRIQPRERLNKELFSIREVDVARGIEREYRGLIMAANTDFGSFETKQTILEGQYPLLNGVERVPDVRRGDVVKMHLISNGLILTTDGMIEEPARIGDQVRIISTQTKKQMVGRLKDSGLVEVRL